MGTFLCSGAALHMIISDFFHLRLGASVEESEAEVGLRH